MEDEATLDMAWGNWVQSNTDQLKKYIPALPALSVTMLQVSDRSGTLVRESE